MIVETFHLFESEDVQLKVSIEEKVKENQRVYVAHYINKKLECYSTLENAQQELTLGLPLMDEQGSVVEYSNKNQLISDIQESGLNTRLSSKK